MSDVALHNIFQKSQLSFLSLKSRTIFAFIQEIVNLAISFRPMFMKPKCDNAHASALSYVELRISLCSAISCDINNHLRNHFCSYFW